MQHSRPPAVAGSFYPADATELRQLIGEFLDAYPPAKPSPVNAVIAPHAGYIYSGLVAAAAYAAITPLSDQLRRVALIGPAHRVRVRGIAISSADTFLSPLGPVPLSAPARDSLLEQPSISVNDAAHEQEHSLEVHLPFLQSVCSDFVLIPMVVGDASPLEVQNALAPFWDSPDTLIVVSTDLSHFHDYETAKRIDAATIQRIIALDYENIHAENACGCRPVNGLLHLLRERKRGIRLLSTANSGDTRGPKDRVVGYGSFISNGP
ncbi:MAG TPA: AmmeMemoRadiSam system protein B [Gammaproteobacteria bacterium]|nr:AmmeMemoRadiSam system protein B [Gammaproteobacteria bacterium]